MSRSVFACPLAAGNEPFLLFVPSFIVSDKNNNPFVGAKIMKAVIYELFYWKSPVKMPVILLMTKLLKVL